MQRGMISQLVKVLPGTEGNVCKSMCHKIFTNQKKYPEYLFLLCLPESAKNALLLKYLNSEHSIIILVNDI